MGVSGPAVVLSASSGTASGWSTYSSYSVFNGTSLLFEKLGSTFIFEFTFSAASFKPYALFNESGVDCCGV